MKVEGLCGGMMRGSGRGRRLNLDFPSSSSPGSLSPSWPKLSLFLSDRRRATMTEGLQSGSPAGRSPRPSRP